MEEQQRELLEQLGDQFALAIEGMLGETWVASLEAVSPSGDGANTLWWGQKLNIHAGVAIRVAAGTEVWREIGTRALASVGMTEPEEADIRATYLELLTQALSGLARFLTKKAGVEVTLDSGSEIPLPDSCGREALRCLRMASPGGYSADLFVHFDPALFEAMERMAAQREPAGRRNAEKQPKGLAQRAAAAGGSDSSTAAPPAMDLLLDVELPVSISFGKTQLPLKEVIKLSTGSIIELNRTIAEPVEVIVNNCVVARGEVVVIEGNYGVRIQHIVSRQDRLRSMD